MVARPDDLKIKATAREALSRVSAFYVSSDAAGNGKELLCRFLKQKRAGMKVLEPQFFGRADLTKLIVSLRPLDSSLAA